MQPTDYMSEVRTRIGAAWGYIQDFELKSRSFFSGKPYAIVCEEEPKGVNKIVRYRFIVLRGIPVNLRIPISGCIAELRAILDNLVWGLSQITGASPSCGIDFPIYLTESSLNLKEGTFEKWVRVNQAVLSKFPTGALDLIHHLQPFNPYNGSQVGSSHPIYVLNKLSNQDKHKMPLKVSGVNQDGPFHLPGPLTICGGTTFQVGKILEHNSVILEMIVPASQPTQNFQVSAMTYIAFDKNSPASSAPVYQFLVNMHDFVRDEVFTKFEPFFPK